MTTTDNNIEIATPEERGSLIHLYGHGYAKLDLAGDDLAEFVQAICGELLAMRKELRTERLVVVHPDDGRELITTDLLPSSIALRVAWLPECDPHVTDAVMVSHCDGPSAAYSAVYASGAGDVMTMLTATAETDDEGTLQAEGDLTVESRRWRDAAIGVPEVGSTCAKLDARGLTFK